MALKNYTVKIGGLDHTLQLSEDDASRLGVLDQVDAPADEATAAPAAKGGRKPRNKAAAPAADKTADEAPASDDTDW